jgi:signal transduction histidine kinase
VRWPRSLRARLLASALGWVVCATLLGGFALSYAFKSASQEVFDSRLQSLLSILIGLAEVNPSGELVLAREIGDPEFSRVYSGWYWLVESDDRKLLRSRSLWDLQLTIRQLPTSSTPTVWTETDPLGRQLRIAAQRVQLPGAAGPLTFVVTGDIQTLKRESQRFDWILRLSLAALGLGLILAVVLQVTFGLRPLQRLAQQTEAVRKGSSQHLVRTGTNEIDMVVDEVNSLIEHNRRVVERNRAATADLAHALKTPLTIMQSADTLEDVRAPIANMERLITRHLARSATAGPGHYAPVPLYEIAQDLVRGLSRVFTDRHLETRIEIGADISFRGDREDMEEILGNLLENAFKWAKAQVLIGASIADAKLSIYVEDDGPGIDEADTAFATRRGMRLDEQTPGTGLGLSIVTDIAAIYHGELQLARSTLGGLRACVILPLR